MPFAVKDLIDLEGCHRSAARGVRAGHAAEEDAAVVQRMRAAGAVLLGKLATYEFALVGPAFDLPDPPAANPWNTEQITGGSSSGSAAAVAGGLLRIAIGTDTGGLDPKPRRLLRRRRA